jgi:hypothetical protein
MHTPTQPGTTRRTTTLWWLPHVTTVVVVVVLFVLLWSDPAQAAELHTAAPPPPPPAPQEAPLTDVINKLIGVMTTLLVALSTLFITAAGVRYVAADGDPGQIERAKKALINACVGFAIAILAPVLVGILQSVLS